MEKAYEGSAVQNVGEFPTRIGVSAYKYKCNICRSKQSSLFGVAMMDHLMKKHGYTKQEANDAIVATDSHNESKSKMGSDVNPELGLGLYDVKVVCPICGAPNWIENREHDFDCCHCLQGLKARKRLVAEKRGGTE